jgi:hypothetical protein
MTDNVKIAMAVGGGYLLGRTKKAKLALGLGMFLAGKRINLEPRQLGKLLAGTPALAGLNQQVREGVSTAGKRAAGAVLNRQAERLADSLSRRTAGLRDSQHDETDEQDDGEQQDEVEQERAASDEETDDAAADESSARSRRGQGSTRTAARRGGNSVKRAGKATTKAAGGRRATASSTARASRGEGK